ncbi:MAG TPA: hypothetical protein VGK67_21830 [Myxococcales bacterium]
MARALESVGIPYFLGGSLASSAQGEPRATNDVGLVVDACPGQIAALAKALGPDFEVDVDALEEAVQRRGSWNIYYLPALLKVDLFQLAAGEYDKREFERRRLLEVFPGERLFVKSPEDSVLRKLLWYRQGGEVSTSQWRDVVEILRVSAASLDRAYLDRWAAGLGIEALLARATLEAKPRTPR